MYKVKFIITKVKFENGDFVIERMMEEVTYDKSYSHALNLVNYWNYHYDFNPETPTVFSTPLKVIVNSFDEDNIPNIITLKFIFFVLNFLEPKTYFENQTRT